MLAADPDELKGALAGLGMLPAIKAGFAACSEGRALVPRSGCRRGTA